MKERGSEKENVVCVGGGKGGFKVTVKGKIMIIKINLDNPYGEQ